MNQDKAATKNVIVSAVTNKKKRKSVVIALVVLLILLGVSAFIVYWSHKPKNPYHVDLTKLTPSQQAQYLSDAGDYRNAEKVWDKELLKAKDTQSKLDIYAYQAAIATKTQHYEDAKKYAEKALELSPNSDIPHVSLAELAQAQGDKVTAKKEWQLAIEHLDKNRPGYNLILRDYTASLGALK
ncbi:MAG TPA: tetratricopeptide repeat protein [Patescibacteria group bacterium]|nr:tetratricopeptide repeat protein [Patescibacteria group bacterium]